jgi:hypothetical protein
MGATDHTGRPWRTVRAWPDKVPGDYLLEVLTPGRKGVRAAHVRHGHFELVPRDDPGMPALRMEARRGEVIAHRPHKRAVIRAKDEYIKVFRPGRAVVSAERCEQMRQLLLSGTFVAPTIICSSTDVIVYGAIPGRTLRDLGEDPKVNDETFGGIWAQWSRAWVAQFAAPHAPTERKILAGLPLHPPEKEATDVWLWVNRWVHHNEHDPESWPGRDALRAKAHEVAESLLRLSPDPLVWAHGDLHDKQVMCTDGKSPLGLLDFDAAARAEAARDLANLDVHLALRHHLHLLTPERYAIAHAQVLAASTDLHVTPARFHAYAAAARLRLACLYSFRPGFGSVSSSLLDEPVLLDKQQAQLPFGESNTPNCTATAPEHARKIVI